MTSDRSSLLNRYPHVHLLRRIEEAEPPGAARGDSDSDDVPDVTAVLMNPEGIGLAYDEDRYSGNDEHTTDTLVPWRPKAKVADGSCVAPADLRLRSALSRDSAASVLPLLANPRLR